MAQLGTIKIQTGSGTKSVPVFDVGDSGGNVYEPLRVQTGSGTGFIPITDPADAALSELRINTGSYGVLAVHDSASITNIFVSTSSTLEGENTKLHVYEDTTGDGNVDNQQTFSLSGGDESFPADKLSMSSGSKLWFRLEAEDSDVTNAAEVATVKLESSEYTETWNDREDFTREQSMSGMTYDSMGDHTKDKIQHGYKHGSITEGLVAYYPMENSGSEVLRDAALNNVGQINGATWNGSGKVGNDSLSFDGSDDAVRTDYNGIGDGGQSFTAMCWHKGESTSLSANYPFITNYVDGEHSGFWWIATTDGSTVEIRLRDNSTNNDSQSSDYSTAYDGSWHHYALIRIAGNSEAKFFIDGVHKETISFPGSNPCKDSDSFFGMMEHIDSNHTPGDLDDVRLYDRALSKAEIEAIVNKANPNGQELTNSEVPGASNGGISRYKFNNDVTDSWGTNDGTDNTSAGYVNGVYGQAKAFDGSDDFVDCNFSSSIGSGAFTVSSWIYPQGTDNDTVMGNYDGSTGFLHRINSGGYELWLDGSDVNRGSVPTNQWTHFVSIRRSDGTVEIYENGNLIGTGSLTGDADSADSVGIGRHSGDNTGANFDGNIGDIRLYYRDLTPEEVERLFHLGAHRIDRSDVLH